MITPEDIKSIEEQKIQDAIKEIDEKIIETHGRYVYDYEFFYTNNIFSDDLIKKVGERYQKAGWHYIYYRTNNLTGVVNFIFSTRELDEKVVKNFNKL